MKKTLKQIMLFFALMASATALQAQQMPPIPFDSAVRVGRLDNGLTYYIRENKLPENRANFYIVQKVGSILEEDNQRGLAHFLEHMAFNGSKNFPAGATGENMISYLETIGVKFGANLNASTGMDETIYNINDVPVNTPGAVEQCLLILHDWSNALLLREKEIDKERKVIHEEWRTGQNAQMRIFEKIAPAIFEGSKYAYRLPIGTMEVIDHFEPQVLRDYYHKWYRPDLQGIIVVGDIDAAEIEYRIQELFSHIDKPGEAAERVYEQIPDNEHPIVAVATDKEMAMNNIWVAFKRDRVPDEMKNGMDYLVLDFATEVIGRMLNDRLEEMMQKSELPFAMAMVMNGPYFGVASKDALQLISVAKPGLAEASIDVLLREARRASEFGFTAGEYERTKASYLAALEKLYNERDKQQNSYYVQQYTDHFLKNEPIPSIADYYNTMTQLVELVPLEAVNQMMRQLVTDNNRVVVIMGSDQETYPSQEEILALIDRADAGELAAYEDNTVSEPLLKELPARGSIVKEETDNDRTTTLWTLSNGARVAVKTTDHKQDEIVMKAVAIGGTSLMDDRYVAEIKLMDDVAAVGGLGQFSATDLKKNLSGKQAEVSCSVGQYSRNADAKSSVKDLETLMQLLYLNFTDVRRDDEAYQSLAGRLKSILPTLSSNPDFLFSDSLMSTMFMGNPRYAIPTVEEIDQADYATLLDLYRSCFADAGAFTFSFVGNVTPEVLKPLVEQYIASLPGTPGDAAKQVKEIPARKGIYDNHFTLPMETPKATTAVVYSGDMEYTPANLVRLSALGQLFQMEFTEKIREEQGGTYGVRVRYEPEKLPREGFTLHFQFDTDPVRRAELVEVMNRVTADMYGQGPDEAMLQKVKEYMLKQHADNLKKNAYDLANTWQYYLYDVDPSEDYAKQVNELTVESVKEFAGQLFGQGNRVEVSMSNQ